MPQSKSHLPKAKKVVIKEPTKREDGSWVVRVVDDWVPLPSELLTQLGWVEGTELEIVHIQGDSCVRQVLIRKKGSLEGADLSGKT
mgnify:CR=1 FL=1